LLPLLVKSKMKLLLKNTNNGGNRSRKIEDRLIPKPQLKKEATVQECDATMINSEQMRGK
jgi:hypothetical protein